MGFGQLALSGILGARAQPGLEPGEGPRTPTLQVPDRHADLPGDGLDRLTPQQAQHHLVLASQAPALTGRERTSPSGLPCDGQYGRAALALAHKPCRINIVFPSPSTLSSSSFSGQYGVVTGADSWAS